MIAFMCAGVPSYSGTSALLKAMGVEDESVVTAFCYRGAGWPGFATAMLADGRKFMIDYDISLGKNLNRHLQILCKIRPDGIGEFADFVCTDGWCCDENGNPLSDEQDRRGLLIARTSSSEALDGRAVAAGDLVTELTPIAKIAHMQLFQTLRKGLVLSRVAAMALTGRRQPHFAGLAVEDNASKRGVKEIVRSLIGTLRRLVAGIREPAVVGLLPNSASMRGRQAG
jgi:coenzyme F420 hydrogenase subunit beta